MRFKVDENLPAEIADLLRAAGHDADTVNDEAWAAGKMPTSPASCSASSALS